MAGFFPSDVVADARMYDVMMRCEGSADLNGEKIVSFSRTVFGDTRWRKA